MNARTTIGDFTNVAPYEFASPTLLSEQPVTDTAYLWRPEADWDAIYSHLESRLGMMRAWRYSWWAHWSRIAEFFCPRRYVWLVVANRMWRGNPINDQIIDSTGALAVRTCTSGMWTGLTSPSRPWFKLGSALPWVQLDAASREWLKDTEERVYTVLAQSNFYGRMWQAHQDNVLFGTAPVLIYEDAEDVVRFYTPRAGEYYADVGSRFSVETLYFERAYNVIQIIEMMGVENAPEQIVRLWNQGGASLQNEYVVCNGIEPNFQIQRRGAKRGQVRVVPGKFAYREVYWLKGQKTEAPMSRKGFHSKPFMCFRWYEEGNEPYGRSPCMDALGDTKQIQMETREKAEFIKKLTKPPMGAPPELKNEPASIIPGNITYFTTSGPGKGFHPLFEVQPAALAPMVDDIDRVSKRIDRCLYVDLFMAISRMEGVQPRNELELTKRDLERLQELGPVIDIAEKELDAGIVRVMGILERRRMLKPMPAALQGVPLKIVYTSILRLAQKAAESVAMKDCFATGGQLSLAAKNAGVPDPLRVINLDRAFRRYCELNNLEPDLLYTQDEVDTHDKARQQAMAAAQAPQQMGPLVDAAKSLSQTSMAPGSALSAMLPPGMGGGGAPQ